MVVLQPRERGKRNQRSWLGNDLGEHLQDPISDRVQPECHVTEEDTDDEVVRSPAEHVEEHLQRQGHPFGDGRSGIRAAGLHRLLEAVDHRQQVGRELLERELVCLLDLPRSPTPGVLRVCLTAQRLIFQRLDLGLGTFEFGLQRRLVTDIGPGPRRGFGSLVSGNASATMAGSST